MKKPTEARIQQDIFQWHWKNCPLERKLLFMVHNEAPDKVKGAVWKSMGLVPGVSDMIYLNPRTKKVMFLEIKTSAGTQSPSQKDFEATVIRSGFDEYFIIRSVEDAIKYCGWKTQ